MPALPLRHLRTTSLFAIAAFAILAGSYLIFSATTQAAGGSNGIEVVTPTAAQNYHSDWTPLGNSPVVEIFVNQPVHNAPANTYNKAAVPISYRIVWAVCLNKTAHARVITRYDANGGKHANLHGTSNSQWKVVDSQLFTEDNCGADRCRTERSFSGTVNLAELRTDAVDTTLQFVAKWHWNSEPDESLDPNSAALKDQLAEGRIHAVNIWLNFAQATPTPTPVVTPTPLVTPTPTPAITPTPTPIHTPTPTLVLIPTPIPTVTPSPTPTPTMHKDLRISKTDHRDITRPGHSLTYVIRVENNSTIDIDDVTVTDTVPSQVTVTEINNGGELSGDTITWYGPLAAGESIELSFTATVRSNTPNQHVLTNEVTVKSDDHDLDDSATDTTVVEREPKVAAIVTTPTPAPPVPVTAKTGPGSVALISTLLGASGLALVNRRVF